MTEQFLSPQALAKRWGVSVGSLANKRSAGTGLPFHRMGDLIRYALSDVEAYEQASRVEPVA